MTRSPCGRSAPDRCSRAPASSNAMEPDTSVILDGLVLAGAPLVIEESADARPRTRSSATARSSPADTASRTAARARLVSPA